LEDDEVKSEGDVVKDLPRRAATLIQQGYAVPADASQRSKRK
jgi:hypothetical protein